MKETLEEFPDVSKKMFGKASLKTPLFRDLVLYSNTQRKTAKITSQITSAHTIKSDTETHAITADGFQPKLAVTHVERSRGIFGGCC